VDPYYKKDQVISDPALLATWENNEDESIESWTFSQGENNSTLLVYKSSHESMVFDVHIFQLGEVKLLDLYPHFKDDQSDGKRFDVIPEHLLMRYEIKDQV